MTRRLLLAGLAVGASGCSMFKLDDVPPEVREAFRNGGNPTCTPIVRRADRVARAEDVDGTTLALWLAPTNDGGVALAVIIEEPDQEPMGMGGWCNAPVDGDSLENLGGIGMSTPGRERSITIGRAPADAETVRADFGAADVIADVGADGYFLVVRSIPDPDGADVMGGVDPSLTALDADGNPLR